VWRRRVHRKFLEKGGKVEIKKNQSLFCCDTCLISENGEVYEVGVVKFNKGKLELRGSY